MKKDLILEGKKLTEKLVFYEAIINTVIVLIVLIFFKGQPKKPPSFVAQIKRERFSIAIREIANNIVYRRIWLAYGLIIGSLQGVTNIIAFLL